MSAPTADRQATGVFSPTRAEIPQRTLRTDRWWQSPLIVDLGFAAFVIYATVRAFLQNNYYVEEYHYLTPFYSPCISKGCVPEASHFWPQILPDVWWLPFAALVAAVPAAVPADLLLLPRRLLPVGVAVPHRVRGRRTACEIHR